MRANQGPGKRFADHRIRQQYRHGRAIRRGGEKGLRRSKGTGPRTGSSAGLVYAGCASIAGRSGRRFRVPGSKFKVLETTKWFIILRSPTEHENGDFRHAGMDCRHPDVQDASGDIHVSLDSSAPCWNDNRGVVLKLTEAPSTSVFSKECFMYS